MPLFKPLKGSIVIRSMGKCVEVPLAHCRGVVFANLKGQHVRLKRYDNTSLENRFWGPIELTVRHSFDKTNDEIVLSEQVTA